MENVISIYSYKNALEVMVAFWVGKSKRSSLMGRAVSTVQNYAQPELKG